MNYKLKIEFDGTHFFGWQKQKNKRTVQGEVENAFRKLIDGNFKIVGCCRTDAGVHALNYVANLKIEGKLKVDEKGLKKAINAILSKDIYVKDIEIVDEYFNARFDAKFKIYRYRILKYPSPLLSKCGFYPKIHLEYEKLFEISSVFLGKRDFGNISAKSDRNNFCNVYESYWIENDSYLDYFIKADRFIYKMVRSIVGMMLYYASGKFSRDDVLKALNFEKSFIPYVVPSKGLTLIEVVY
jgi:tRNA pseudouridine38-40 synthase